MKNNYDTNVGYSPLEHVNMEKLSRDINIKINILDQYRPLDDSDIIFVAGMGNGDEAVALFNEYKVMTIGSDLFCDQFVSIQDKNKLFFQYQNLMSLGYANDTFSLIYCNHVLEHVVDHMTVLRELQRVLKPGGVLFIGFPNKNRLFGYIGTSQNASFFDKIQWNLNDYRFKLQGKFENKYGAHAGFTQKEFYFDTSELFSIVHAVGDQFMLGKYHKFRAIIGLLIKFRINGYIFPSNYYVCEKSIH